MTRRVNLPPFLLATIFFSPARAQQEDPYAEAIVREALTTHVITSFAEKALSRLGDRAAIGVMRSLADKGLSDAVETKRALWVLQTAFSAPGNIAEPADRTPKATLFLLRCIGDSAVGQDLSDDIGRTKHAILSAERGSQSPAEP